MSRDSLVLQLTRAKAALRAGAPDDALRVLLDAWRSNRLPRLADVIEHVSGLSTAKRPPISGRTGAARRLEWERVEEARDPADLGRLLAVPWPGKWQEAIPVSERLFGWPDDPRLAKAFADVCVTATYDSWKTHGFYLPVLGAIAKLGDKRAADLLRSNDGGLRSYYGKRPLARQRDVVATLDALPQPALSPGDERALAELERGFAGEAAGARTQEELFEAVLAAPDDAGARAVWADVLTTRGDPRGELVMLMLADEEGRGTPKGTRRLAALLKKHARAFAGDLDEVLEEEPRLYERGLLSGGVVRGAGSLEKLAARASRHVLRSLDARNLRADSPAFPLERLPTLCALYELPGELAARLAGAAPSGLRALSLSSEPPAPAPGGAAPEDARRELASGRALPALELFGAPSSAAPWLLGSRLLRQVKTLAAADPLELARWMQALRGGVDRPVLVSRGSFLREEGWHLEARPSSEGTRYDVEAAWKTPGEARVAAFVTFLGALPDDAVRTLVVRAEALSTHEGGLERLRRALGRMRALERVELTWAPEVAVTPGVGGTREGAFDGGDAGLRLFVSLDRPATKQSPGDAAVLLWDAVEPLQLGLDTVSNPSGEDRYGALVGRDARAILREVAASYQEAWSYLRVSREDAPSIHGDVHLAHGNMGLSLPWPLRVDFVDWLVQLVDELGPCHGAARLQSLHRLPAMPELSPFCGDLQDRASPVMVVGTRLRPLLDEGAMLGLSSIPGVRVRATKRAFVVSLGDRLDAVPEDAARAFARALRPLVEAAFERRWGYHPLTLARDRLAGAIAERELDYAITAPLEPDSAVDTYRTPSEDGDVSSPWEIRAVETVGNDFLGRPILRGLVLQVHAPFARPSFKLFRLEPSRSADKHVTQYMSRLPAAGRDEATASLDRVARERIT